MPGPRLIKVTLPDGLSIEVRAYQGGGKAPAVCIPGLTRNARDFEDFAPWLARTGRDVYALSLRGRGGSDYDPDYLNYHPAAYSKDVVAALDALDIASAIFVGTSLGGIVTMLTNASAPERVAAAIINDVGPELAPEGLARIAGYVGGARADARGLDEAAARIKAINAIAFPGRSDDFWRAFARRTFREVEGGRWRLDYDLAVAKALEEVGPAPDLWPGFESLKGKPTLVIHGGLSDLLTPAILEKMRAVNPDFELCEVAGVGHAPMLDEPEAQAAIAAFVERIA